MNRDLRWYDYITINIFWFALTSRSQVLSPLIVPVLVQRFVGDAVKGTYVGRMRLWSLMVALLVQALMGLISDHAKLPWGRRRPFIAVGTLAEIAILLSMGLLLDLEGMTGYWALFGLYTLGMVASNTSHAATQGLIPDLVPEEKRGRFSGVKAFLELPIPLVFSSFVVAKMVAAGNLWEALLALSAVLFVSMVVTMFAPKSPPEEDAPPLDWQPFLRLLLMTAAFTLIILGAGAVVNLWMRWTAGLASDLQWIATVVGGVIGITFAVLVGVKVSIDVSLGEDAPRQRSFTWWVTNRLTFMVASTNLAGFMLYYLQERFPDLRGEEAAGPAATVMLFVGLFIMVTAVPGGWLADRFGKRGLVTLAGIVAAVGTFVILLVPALTVMYVGGGFIGAAIGLFYSANWALGTEIVPQAEAGRYLGISNLAGAGAGAIGAYIGGPIADAHGYVVLFTIYGTMFVLAALAVQGVEARYARPAVTSSPISG